GRGGGGAPAPGRRVLLNAAPPPAMIAARHCANDSVPVVPRPVEIVPPPAVPSSEQAAVSVARAYASAARSNQSWSASGVDQLIACHEMSPPPRYVSAETVTIGAIIFAVPASVFSAACLSTCGRCVICG